MAAKKPLVIKSGTVEEVRATDTLTFELLQVTNALRLPVSGVTAGTGSVKIESGQLQADFGSGYEVVASSGDNILYNNVAQTGVKVAYYNESDLVANYSSGWAVNILGLSATSILNVAASVRLSSSATITSLLGVSAIPVVDGLSSITVKVYTTFSDPDEVLFYEIDPSGSYTIDGYEQYKTGSIIQSIDLMVVYKDS